MKTQQQRIFEFLAKGPATPKEIATALDLTIRQVHVVGNKNQDLIKKQTITTWSLLKEVPRTKRLRDFYPIIEKLRKEDASWPEIQKTLERLGYTATINTIYMNYRRNNEIGD